MTIPAQTRAWAEVAALAAADKLGQNIQVLDVSKALNVVDCFLLVTGDNERQVAAIVEEIEFKLEEIGVTVLRREGRVENRWTLLDYGILVVHVFRKQEREFYALDRLYKDCPIIEIPGIEQEKVRIFADGAEEVDIRQVTSAEELPLAGPEPYDEM